VSNGGIGVEWRDWCRMAGLVSNRATERARHMPVCFPNTIRVQNSLKIYHYPNNINANSLGSLSEGAVHLPAIWQGTADKDNSIYTLSSALSILVCCTTDTRLPASCPMPMGIALGSALGGGRLAARMRAAG